MPVAMQHMVEGGARPLCARVQGVCDEKVEESSLHSARLLTAQTLVVLRGAAFPGGNARSLAGMSFSSTARSRRLESRRCRLKARSTHPCVPVRSDCS